jgi:hypothetical protein
MDALLEPKRAPTGLFPELVLFDCQSCHHPYNSLRGGPYGNGGLPPGSVKLDDANAVMLRVVAARLAPTVAKALGPQVLALRRATTENWAAVKHQANDLRLLANELVPILSSHSFIREDLRALADGVVALGLTDEGTRYSEAEQATMALASIASAEKSAGNLSDEQASAITDAMNRLYGSFAADETYRHEPFVKALREFQKL